MNTDADTDLHSNDLTQLSSREQLSALMDSALPPDQTRFLLRRLQHDAALAESWDRWRIAGEVMRGLAPARRLPADFATRVAASLAEGAVAGAPVEPRVRPRSVGAWLRWGGGAAMAASLAVVALMARQPVPGEGPDAPPARVAAAIESPRPGQPVPAPQPPAPVGDSAGQLAGAATAVALAASRPQRDAQVRTPASAARRSPAAAVVQVAALDGGVQVPAVAAPQPDIVTRPWPRSVLPQYASSGLAVGFGDQVRGHQPFNPFASTPVVGAPPAAEGEDEAEADAGRAAEPAADPQAQAARP